jgi:hypothetical protein
MSLAGVRNFGPRVGDDLATEGMQVCWIELASSAAERKRTQPALTDLAAFDGESGVTQMQGRSQLSELWLGALRQVKASRGRGIQCSTVCPS